MQYKHAIEGLDRMRKLSIDQQITLKKQENSKKKLKLNGVVVQQ